MRRTSSVLEQQAVVGASLRSTTGVATARRARETVEKRARRENILGMLAVAWRGVLCCSPSSLFSPFYTARPACQGALRIPELRSLRARVPRSVGVPMQRRPPLCGVPPRRSTPHGEQNATHPTYIVSRAASHCKEWL